MGKQIHSPKDVDDQPRKSDWPFAKTKDLERLERKIEKIMATQAEIAKQLNDVKAVLEKVATEEASLVTKIAELQEIINNMGDAASPELIAAAQAVTDQAGVLDAIVPDAPPAP